VIEAELELDAVTSGYGDLTVIRDVSFAVLPGNISVLLGRNGAGKTTLLKTIAGLLPVSRGDIQIEGVSVIKEPPYRRQMRGLGFVQENKRVFKRRSVEDNLMMGAYASKLGPQRGGGAYFGGLRPVPCAGGQAEARRGIPERRGTADARHQPGPDQPSTAPPAG
jgi:ABC-type branched-subunit amino acid transport system ATPase component